MESQTRSSDWRSMLLLIFSLGSAFVILSTAMALLVMFLVNDRMLSVAAPLTNILGATTLTAIGLLLLPAGVLSWQRLKGRSFESFELRPLPVWALVLLPVLWLVVISLATLLYEAPGAAWYVPFLHFLAVALPVYILVRIGIRAIPLGSIQRVWAVFASGYSLSLLLAIVLEVLMLLLVVIVLGVFVGLDPGRLGDLERFARQVERARDIESLLPIVAPLLKSPLTLLAALSFLSVFVPFVEELAKSIGVWLVVDRLSSPAQGFALGFLSGAGFALAESLSATLTPDTTWALSFVTRSLSGSMHMLASGLVGMGIASLRLEKRFGRMAILTLLAMLLHASWNAGAVLTVAGGLRVALAVPGFDLAGVLFGTAGIGLLLVLTASMAVAMVLVNLRLRRPMPQAENGLE